MALEGIAEANVTAAAALSTTLGDLIGNGGGGGVNGFGAATTGLQAAALAAAASTATVRWGVRVVWVSICLMEKLADEKQHGTACVAVSFYVSCNTPLLVHASDKT